MELSQVLLSLAAGGLTVPAAKWVLSLGIFYDIGNGQKRGIAIGLCFTLGAIGYLGLIYTNVSPMPITIEAWANGLWPVGTGAYFASQVVLSWLRVKKPDYGKA